MRLDELAIHFGTDKSSLCHAYTQYYEMFFEPIRYNHTTLLEIGIDSGNSLKMWHDYFDNGGVSGIDIRGGYEYLNEMGIQTFIVDQSSEQQLKDFNQRCQGCFDIIILDGSHNADDDILSFNILFEGLKSGGFFCVEDNLCSYDTSRWGAKANWYDRSRQLIGEVSMNGKMSNDFLCSNKKSEAFKYFNNLTYFELTVEWVFQSAGLCIIKKM